MTLAVPTAVVPSEASTLQSACEGAGDESRPVDTWIPASAGMTDQVRWPALRAAWDSRPRHPKCHSERSEESMGRGEYTTSLDSSRSFGMTLAVPTAVVPSEASTLQSACEGAGDESRPVDTWIPASAGMTDQVRWPTLRAAWDSRPQVPKPAICHSERSEESKGQGECTTSLDSSRSFGMTFPVPHGTHFERSEASRVCVCRALPAHRCLLAPRVITNSPIRSWCVFFIVTWTAWKPWPRTRSAISGAWS